MRSFVCCGELVVAGRFAKGRCFVGEDLRSVTFMEDEQSSEGKNAVKNGYHPKQPVPANALSYDSAEDRAKGRTLKVLAEQF